MVNPLQAFSLSDGSIVLGDGLNGYFSLRYYDLQGKLQVETSRWGQGPFEFQFATGLVPLPADSVLVVGTDGRYAIFGPRGERARDGRLSLPPGFVLTYQQIVAADPEHLLLVPAGGGDSRDYPGVGVNRGEIEWALHQLGGRTEVIARSLSAPGYYEPMRDRPGVRIYSYPFPAETSAAGGGGLFWIAQADVPEITAYGTDGARRLTIRFSDPAASVTGNDRRWFESTLMAGSPESRKEDYARYLRRAEYPKQLPHFGRIEVDRLGRLWVERYVMPGSDTDRLWDVFSQSGEWVDLVSFPSSLLPRCARSTRVPCDVIRDLGADHVLVDWWGQLDVRRVQRHEVVDTR